MINILKRNTSHNVVSLATTEVLILMTLESQLHSDWLTKNEWITRLTSINNTLLIYRQNLLLSFKLKWV